MQITSYLDPILAASCGDAPHLAVALSGGADSMALTLLMHDWCARHHKTLTTLTVDHGLRDGSATEAVQVAGWMQSHGIAHHILTPPPLPIPNLQTRAREMRYGALSHWCRTQGVQTLLLGHHADDQAETFALQQHRGAEGPSRSGMALVSMRGPLRLVRPLLGVRKRTLTDWLVAHRQPWVEDPTNQNDAYARNRLRRTLSDADTARLWHAAQQGGAARHAAEQARNAWLAQHASALAHGIRLDYAAWRTLDDAPRTDILSQMIRAVGGKRFRPRHHETTRLDDALRREATGKATLGHCLLVWNQQSVTCQPEALESPTNQSHITGEAALKQLGNTPFWWFNYSPYF